MRSHTGRTAGYETGSFRTLISQHVWSWRHENILWVSVGVCIWLYPSVRVLVRVCIASVLLHDCTIKPSGVLPGSICAPSTPAPSTHSRSASLHTVHPRGTAGKTETKRASVIPRKEVESDRCADWENRHKNLPKPWDRSIIADSWVDGRYLLFKFCSWSGRHKTKQEKIFSPFIYWYSHDCCSNKCNML